ncbi:MAG: hypothetical protein BV459_00210 [Thermoplasmata archaeon M11B2D]|nr:MAG: hypothetical protein BV459_00210 [Thermoplasmata archaeon M11B2D]
MMKKFLKKLKEFFCIHDFETGSAVGLIRATLDWDFTPTRATICEIRCAKCGKKLVSSRIVYGDKELHPEFYGEDGWPIDGDGNRLDIYRFDE